MNFWFWDMWLIGQFERFAHWFQRQTGKTNYFLCRVCCLFFAIAIVADTALGKGFYSSNAVLVAFVICGAFVYAMYTLYEEKRVFQRLEKGIANPNKVRLSERFFRLLIVVLFLYSAIMGGLLFLFFSFYNQAMQDVRHDFVLLVFSLARLFNVLSAFYFDACDPLPPCKGKLWERISALFAVREPALSLSGAKA